MCGGPNKQRGSQLRGTAMATEFMKRKNKLYTAAFLYLLTPYILFLLLFLRKEIGIPLAIIATATGRSFIKNQQVRSSGIKIQINKKLLAAMIILLLWVLWAGVGGFTWQNYWDHKFRNAVFMDLVGSAWPAQSGEKILSYYLGFWLPSALVGKIFGLTAGYVAQVLWAYIGLCMVYLLICERMGSIQLRYLMVFILFSGLDVIAFVGMQLASGEGMGYILAQLQTGQHIEIALDYFNCSSNTTLLFWLYNQCIPFWVGFLLFLAQKKVRFYGVICVLLLLYSPFPLVGMLPMVLYRMVFQNHRWKNFAFLCRDCLSVENIVSVALAIPLVCYFGCNIAVSKLQILPCSRTVLLRLLCYAVLEYGIYLVFVIKNKRWNASLAVLGITTLVFSFVVLGNSYDFAWRTCIPFAFYIMLKLLQVIDDLLAKGWRRNAELFLLICVMMVGMATPLTEMIRSVRGEIAVFHQQESARSDSLSSVFVRENKCYDNFIGSMDSFYGKYLMPHNQ